MRTFGKYRLVEPLASGGMADVWRAEVSGAEGVVKDVALKLVRGEHAEKSAFVRMFVQEARLAVRLSHANVVQVFEFDQIAGRYYIAMELVRGRHLGQVIERARELGVRFGVARAVHVAAEVAKALAYAHRATDAGRPLGLVHRDVSPHNVLVSFEGEVKLADFGIAHAMNAAERTDPGTVKGKLAYMAPEQARGVSVDARADVFSLGVVLWELCTGRRLLARDSDAATLAAVLGDEPLSPPSAWNEEVPGELDRAVLGALERDPARRTPSAQDLATVLSGVLLRVARSPEDVDLRAFVQRLFPDEAALATSGAPAQEATRVRPAAREESATRTAAVGAAGEGRIGWRGIAAGVALAAALAGGAAVWRATGISRARPTASGDTPVHAERSASAEAEARIGRAPAPPPTSTEPPASPTAGEPAARAQDGAADAKPGADRPIEWVHAIGRLKVPRAESHEGILSVNATPWGTVVVNDVVLGESPLELRIHAGKHRIRVDRKGQRGSESIVAVPSGLRTHLSR